VFQCRRSGELVLVVTVRSVLVSAQHQRQKPVCTRLEGLEEMSQR
jgi:hypothetical protein